MIRTLVKKIEAANAALLAEGDLDAVEEFFTADYVAHGTGRPAVRGRDGVARYLRSLLRALPILELEVEILVAKQDRVAWQRTLTATHERPYKGFPASGRKLVWRDMVTSRFEDGLIAEEWVVSDLAEQLLRARKR